MPYVTMKRHGEEGVLDLGGSTAFGMRQAKFGDHGEYRSTINWRGVPANARLSKQMLFVGLAVSLL